MNSILEGKRQMTAAPLAQFHETAVHSKLRDAFLNLK